MVFQILPLTQRMKAANTQPPTPQTKNKPRISRKIHFKDTNLLGKTIETNRRFRAKVGARFKFLLPYSELAPTNPRCNTPRTPPGRKKYEETMFDENPLR